MRRQTSLALFPFIDCLHYPTLFSIDKGILYALQYAT